MSSRTVYALLVGIDTYAGGVPALNGCKNDIVAIEDLLTVRVEGNGEHLSVERLLDGQATRAAVIDRFRHHLGKAGPDDVALFYYSGHGSQEPAPEEFWEIEPDHLDETLVLYDSRTEGQWDLADKELAGLIGELTKRPHTLVVLDCCHSGSGTRAARDDAIAVRRAPNDRRNRPLHSFLFAQQAAALSRPAGQRSAMGDSGWAIPSSEHVLIAASRSNETAKEVIALGAARGALSAALEAVLTAGGWSIRYRDLHRQLAASVEVSVREQHPQVEATRAAALEELVLGGLLPAVPGSFVASRRNDGWVIDGGRMHGIPAPSGTETSRLVVLGTDGGTIAKAVVTAVRAGESDIDVEPADVLTPGLPYRAVLTDTPLPPLVARFAGDPDKLADLRGLLADRDRGGGPVLVSAAADGEKADVFVTATADGFRATKPGAERSLAPTAPTADGAVGMLEQMAVWFRTAALRNPSTRLPADAVGFTLEPEPRPGKDSEPDEIDGGYRLPYVSENGKDRPRRYAVTVANRSDSPIWYALLDLTDTYGIYTDAVKNGSQELQGGESQSITLRAVVPDAIWEQGGTETTDILKLVVSSAQFDPRNLQRGDLDVTRSRDVTSTRASFASTLDRLVQRMSTRRAEPETGDEELADWFTRDLVVVAVRPRPGVGVSAEDTVDLAPGVRVAAHPTFKGRVRVTSTSDATRDVLAAAPLPPLFAEHPEDNEPFALLATRASGGPDALVVDVDAAGTAAVTEGEPLVLDLDRQLDDGERVLPYAWDGEFYVPLGFSRPSASGTGTEIVLQRLSEPVVTERSLLGSIRILFRKLVGQRLGFAYDYPLLRLATVGPDGRVDYTTDLEEIRRAVAAAPSVLLYVHGIIGDTDGMVRSSTASDVRAVDLVGGRYQAILAFDYENLDTTIEENARHLADGLRAVGLGDQHDKRFDIVAHSMGGLVSRYLLEFVGGVRVTRLVTLGTPHGGSPWPTVQKWATGISALALNSLTAVAWPVHVLTGVVGLIEKVDSALDEMEPESTFLATLASGKDPELPYIVIVGNRSLIDPGRGRRLLSRIVGGVADLAFLNSPNDLAVAVTSARRLPQERQPAPVFREIPCDHITFFSTEAGLRALSDALRA